MPATEAQLAANRANSLKSTGPKTEEGKARSRANAYKHGLAGKGVVVPEANAAAVVELYEVLEADLKPKSPMGALLLQAVAVASVKLDRAARHETDAIARRVRHACADFVEGRHAEAEALFDALHQDPRTSLRRLKKSPEGVDRLIEGWRELRDSLAGEGRPRWTAAHLEQAVVMTGGRPESARDSRLGFLSRGAWGDFTALADDEGAGLDDDARQGWARAKLVERIDAEIAALEEHYETLDFETILTDCREAPGRALFDPSKEATLARRYEAAALRAFHKAAAEFKLAEAEAAERREANRRPASMPAPPLASIRQATPPAEPGRSWAAQSSPMVDDRYAKEPDGKVLAVGVAPKSPG